MEQQDNSQSMQSPSPSVGEQLRAAREAQGLSRSDIAVRTRVAERHLNAIEQDHFSELAAPTYAVGFSRAYARAVGLDEADIARRVRLCIDAQTDSRPAPVPSFEPGDPARVPPSLFAWITGIVAIVLVGLALVYWSDLLAPQGDLPDLVPEETQAARQTVAAPPAVAPVQTAVPAGPVVLTATAPAVWVKITDGAGNQVFQKELAQGESYSVPSEVQAPQLRTARPDVLQITVGGRAIPRLGDTPQVISGVLLTPAALLERANLSGTPAAASTAAPAVSGTAGLMRGGRPTAPAEASANSANSEPRPSDAQLRALSTAAE